MTLSHLFLILRAQLRLLVLAGLAGLALAAIWAFTSTRTYTASTEVLVGVRAPDTVGNDQPLAQLQPDYLSTQADVIRSERVAQAAVRTLGLASDPAVIADYRKSGGIGDPSVALANRLRSGLSVRTSATSRVVTIGYNSANPQFAADAANAFARAYQTVSLDLQIEPARAASSWYDKTAADLAQRLAQAQGALNRRSAQLGLTAAEDPLDSDITRLNSLSSQLAMAQAAQATARSKTADTARDALLDPVAQQIQTQIATLEAQRRQLATYAGPNNVDYRQVSGQIDALRQQLAAQKAQVAQGNRTGAVQSGASVADLNAAVAAQKQRVIASTRGHAARWAALQQDVDNLKATYEQFVAKRSQVNLLGTGGQTNISVLSPAVTPSSPAGPSPLMKLAVGLVAGLIVGIAIALCREFLDQRIRSSEDADLWLGIPDLGSIRPLNARRSVPLLSAATRYLPSSSEASA